MNKPNVEEVCEQIVTQLISDGYTYQVSKEDIEKVIFKTRGIDERTVIRWLKVLLAFNYLVIESKTVYRLNPSKIPHLIQTMRDKPQTRLSSGNTLSHTQSSEEG